jgi:hypothetical protein
MTKIVNYLLSRALLAAFRNRSHAPWIALARVVARGCEWWEARKVLCSPNENRTQVRFLLEGGEMKMHNNDRDELEAALAKRKVEFQLELAALTMQLQEAEERVAAASAAIARSRDLRAQCDAGFKRSMERVLEMEK